MSTQETMKTKDHPTEFHKKLLKASATICVLSAIPVIVLFFYPCIVKDAIARLPEAPTCGDHYYSYDYYGYDHTDLIQWTPDGRKIVFDFDPSRALDQAIWSVNTDGTGLRMIADGRPYDWREDKEAANRALHKGLHGDLSPDGTMLVYSTCDIDKDDLQFPENGEPGSMDLAITKMDGTAPWIITPDPGKQHYPAWSPDGTRIAFLHSDPLVDPTALAYLRILNVQKSGQVNYPTPTPDPEPDRNWAHHQFQGGKTPNLKPPVWSPDSQYIAYIQGDGPTYNPGPRHKHWEVVVAHTGNGNQLTSKRVLGISTADPTWSPDSSRLAFASKSNDDHPDPYISIVNPDGSGKTEIPVRDRRSITHLAWHPDGLEILIAATDLYILNIEDESLRKLWSYPDRESWAYLIKGLAWSPDGNRIAIKIGSSTSEWKCRLNLITARRDGQDIRLTVANGPNSAVPIVGTNEILDPNQITWLHLRGADCTGWSEVR